MLDAVDILQETSGQMDMASVGLDARRSLTEARLCNSED